MAAPKKKAVAGRKRASRMGLNMSAEGERPVDLVTHIQKQTQKQRQLMFDQITAASRINCKGFLENRAHNRVPVPIHEKKRVLLTMVKEGDSEYFPATYACCERDDYILTQAPTKENYRDFWRMVWRDGCKICVSLSEKLSDSDAELCYPYWPATEGEKMEIDGNRFVIECQKKTDFKGYAIYDLRLASTDPAVDTTTAPSKSVVQAKEGAQEEPSEEKKTRSVTLMHYESWPTDTWPDLDLLGPFVQALSKREIQIMRKSLDNYIPPVVIQSHDGLGRAPIIWVSTILMKDIEKKECFDVEDLAKKCARCGRVVVFDINYDIESL
ncbi:hypothetical protein Y032_0550g3303 [Ancylostoma ceylanicum]|uniref:Tyrosine-protein phosphatase domain-containing protein n=2 Tax=Ancylostoma ceylanicum TaxID=53326 RepID=A0A016WQP6_9BILA|nr:hypothetical protein Y032_0550g3303 [Ancylostoma ceylanicum]